MLQKLITTVLGDRDQQRKKTLYHNLIRREAQIGGTVFGPIPAGTRREFFCLDERTWVWHEEWKDEANQLHVRMTRYDIRPNGVLKSQNGVYQTISPAEAQRLRRAIELYYDRVSTQMYAGIA